MFDLLASIGSAAIGDIIKRAIAAGIDWGKRRKKPPSEEVRQKVEELVAAAAKKTPLPESTAEQQRIISGITELTLPTFEQVVDYSPNTRGIVHAARSAVKKSAAKKSAAKKAAPKKAAPKKAAPRRASTKNARRVAKKASKKG